MDSRACGSREKCTWLGMALFLLTIFLCWALQVRETENNNYTLIGCCSMYCMNMTTIKQYLCKPGALGGSDPASEAGSWEEWEEKEEMGGLINI